MRFLASLKARLPGPIARFGRREAGSVIILAAVGTLGAMALSGLTIDYGKVLVTRRALQNAADSAALAGAGILKGGGSSTTAASTADTWLTNNGAVDASSVANIPPTSGNNVGNNQCVEAVAHNTINDTFTPGLPAPEIQAKAVACVTYEPYQYSFLVLDPTACSALQLNGNDRITVSGGGVMVNSSCAGSAVNLNGNIDITSTANTSVGGTMVNGNVHITPPWATGAAVPDPLASLPAPPSATTVRTCPNLNGNGTHNFLPGRYNCTISPNGNWTLNFDSGDYYITGGVTLNGNITVNMGAGVYKVAGQGFRANGNQTVNSSGSMLYVEAGCLILNGNAIVDLNAPTSGTYEGVAVFQARSNTCDMTFNGNGSLGQWGTVYAPNGTVTFNGNGSSSYQFIVNKFRGNGNADINITWNDNHEAQVPTIRLFE